MSDAYRDEHEAALRHLDALRRENDALREQLAHERGERAVREGRSAQGPMVMALLTGVFFLAGAVTMAGASQRRCAAGRRVADSPCPYLAAHGASSAHGGSVFDRGERLLRNEPGVVRVELAPGSESAQVRVDGLVIPRSGAVALSGPLAGGATHVVDVSAGGFIQSRTRVWVHPGRTEVVRVALSPDPTARDAPEEPVEE